VEGDIGRMFKGEMENYISCVKVDYTSSRKEDFYDLSLIVKDCHDIYDSLDKYIEVEMMDGDNQYQAGEEHGLQDAKMGKRFLSLPPFLQLHLKRFEYDFDYNRMMKLNTRYEYYDELDLSKYVHVPEGGEGGGVSYRYVLHSVLIHGGDVHAGHYYAYIKPTSQEAWFKYDDEEVSPYPSLPIPFGRHGSPDCFSGCRGRRFIRSNRSPQGQNS